MNNLQTPKFAMSSLGLYNNKMVQSSLARQETKKRELKRDRERERKR